MWLSDDSLRLTEKRNIVMYFHITFFSFPIRLGERGKKKTLRYGFNLRSLKRLHDYIKVALWKILKKKHYNVFYIKKNNINK